jgi:hypothetical protein
MMSREREKMNKRVVGNKFQFKMCARRYKNIAQRATTADITYTAQLRTRHQNNLSSHCVGCLFCAREAMGQIKSLFITGRSLIMSFVGCHVDEIHRRRFAHNRKASQINCNRLMLSSKKVIIVVTVIYGSGFTDSQEMF